MILLVAQWFLLGAATVVLSEWSATTSYAAFGCNRNRRNGIAFSSIAK